jgi:hypothetical protein
MQNSRAPKWTRSSNKEAFISLSSNPKADRIFLASENRDPPQAYFVPTIHLWRTHFAGTRAQISMFLFIRAREGRVGA